MFLKSFQTDVFVFFFFKKILNERTPSPIEQIAMSKDEKKKSEKKRFHFFTVWKVNRVIHWTMNENGREKYWFITFVIFEFTFFSFECAVCDLQSVMWFSIVY